MELEIQTEIGKRALVEPKLTSPALEESQTKKSFVPVTEFRKFLGLGEETENERTGKSEAENIIERINRLSSETEVNQIKENEEFIRRRKEIFCDIRKRQTVVERWRLRQQRKSVITEWGKYGIKNAEAIMTGLENRASVFLFCNKNTFYEISYQNLLRKDVLSLFLDNPEADIGEVTERVEILTRPILIEEFQQRRDSITNCLSINQQLFDKVINQLRESNYVFPFNLSGIEGQRLVSLMVKQQGLNDEQVETLKLSKTEKTFNVYSSNECVIKPEAVRNRTAIIDDIQYLSKNHCFNRSDFESFYHAVGQGQESTAELKEKIETVKAVLDSDKKLFLEALQELLKVSDFSSTVAICQRLEELIEISGVVKESPWLLQSKIIYKNLETTWTGSQFNFYSEKEKRIAAIFEKVDGFIIKVIVPGTGMYHDFWKNTPQLTARAILLDGATLDIAELATDEALPIKKLQKLFLITEEFLEKYFKTGYRKILNRDQFFGKDFPV